MATIVTRGMARGTVTAGTAARTSWERILLLCILGYEGVGGLVGGTMLVAAPDGSSMEMPVEIMHGAFADFTIPGCILFVMGVITAIAFTAVLFRRPWSWLMANISMWGFMIWFWIEIGILQEIHWLHFMWGLPVIGGTAIATRMMPHLRYNLWRLGLLCGILSSLLYALINVIVAMQWQGYDSMSYTVSELSAVAAPTRRLWMVLCTPYTLLMLAFSWAVFTAGRGNRRLRWAGVLLIAYSALGLVWPFAPMHSREALAAGGGTLSDTMHLVLAGVTEVIYLTALGLSAFALGKGFRTYSVLTFLVLAVFGFLTFRDAPGVSANLPTPWIGLWERINIGVFLLWVIVLAAVLYRRRAEFASALNEGTAAAATA